MEDMEQLDGIQCKGLVLKMITGLKQICNHPDNHLKKSLANLTVAAGEKWIGDLTNSELREIFRLE
jgi:SNF2 family DNA or RNA helicase